MKWLLSRGEGFLFDKQIVCKYMRFTECNYSSRNYMTFTEPQVSLPEIYKTKVIALSIPGIVHLGKEVEYDLNVLGK